MPRPVSNTANSNVSSVLQQVISNNQATKSKAEFLPLQLPTLGAPVSSTARQGNKAISSTKVQAQNPGFINSSSREDVQSSQVSNALQQHFFHPVGSKQAITI